MILYQSIAFNPTQLLQAIEKVPADQKEAAARSAKMRTLGNIRLIAELFKKNVVPEKIVQMCVQDLIGDAKQEPTENNVEVSCFHNLQCISSLLAIDAQVV